MAIEYGASVLDHDIDEGLKIRLVLRRRQIRVMKLEEFPFCLRTGKVVRQEVDLILPCFITSLGV